jgi:hypothetical protein
MEKEFIESNIVLLGNYNPATFDKLFFIKNNLIDENLFSDKSVFTPNYCRIITENLIISVDSNQILLVTQKVSESILEKCATSIIEHKGGTKAIGCNFKWYIFVDEKIENHTKSQFYPINNKFISSEFDTPTSAFGYYASKDFHSSRMKIDIKPIGIKNINTNEDKSALSFDFNFHIEEILKSKSISDVFKDYALFKKEVNKFIESYE